MRGRHISREEIINATRRWVERAVIGLALCPFAESVYVRKAVRFQVSERRAAGELLVEVHAELLQLQATPARDIETTLLIHPWVLNDFLEFNDFLEVCDQMLIDLGLEGEIQVASFHPQYQFAGTAADDVGNYTNRSPYPTLHLLREASVEKALRSFPQPETIYLDNIARLRMLGPAACAALFADERSS